MITGKTRFFGLIGSPITHSLSPLIHNYLFKNSGRDAVYGCFETKDLKTAVCGLKALTFSGFNVTIPFKEKVLPFLDTVDKKAEIIGAVNTVAVSGSGLKGFNTDCTGFLLSLKRVSFTVKGSSAVILGAGGAARALSTGLAEKKAKQIIVYDCVRKKAEHLAEDLSLRFPLTEITAVKKPQDIDPAESDILVNATGLGLKKNDPLPLKLDRFHKDLLVYDLIYSPRRTAFMSLAEKKGLKTCSGLWMLIFQALEAQRIWFGTDCLESALPLYNYLLRKGL